MTFNSKTIKKTVATLAFLMLVSQSAFSQDVAALSTTELQTEAASLVADKNYITARPYVEQLILRFKDSESPASIKELEQLYFFEAYSYLQEYDSNKEESSLNKAIEGFNKVLKDYPTGNYAESAIRTKAACYEMLSQWDKAIETRELLLTPPYVNKLNYQQQYDIVKRIAELLYSQRNWQLGEKWFQRMLISAKTGQDKLFAAAGLVQGKIKAKEYESAKQYFPYLMVDAPARSDISLNIAMLEAGDALVKDDKFSLGSVFYNMVLNRDDILANYDRYIAEATAKSERATRLNPDNPIAKDLQAQKEMLEAQRKVVVDNVDDYSADLMARSARNYMLTERDFEGFWAYQQIIKAFPEHDSIEDFYMAAIVAASKIGKDETSFKLVEEYLAAFEDGTYYLDAMLQKIQYFLKKEDFESFFAEAKAFIEENPDESPFSSDVIYLMGSTWMKQGQYAQVIETFNAYTEDNEDTAISEGTMYWAGLAYLASGKFQEAMDKFLTMTEEYPNGVYSEDGLYRAGVAAYGVGDFEKSRECLEDFLDMYTDSQLRGEVEFFLGDIYAGAFEIDKAMQHYANVEKYTKNQNYIDNSYTQSAELLNTSEAYEKVIKLMDQYISKYPEGAISEITLIKAKATEVLGLPADALQLYSDVITKYGSNPKDDGVDKMILDYDRMYSKNIIMLEATVELLEKLLTDEILLNHMVAVPAKRYRYFQDNPTLDKSLYEKFKRDSRFGTILYKDKTAIKNLLDQYKGQIAKYPQGGTVKIFNDMIADALSANNKTLAYRLMMGLDTLNAPYKDLNMFNDDDIKIASVRTLVWIGKINEAYTSESARAAFAEAMSRDEFDYLIDALFGSAQLEERLATKGEGDWETVLNLYSTVESDFPVDIRAATAVLKKAEVLTKLGRRDEAFELYEQIMKTPMWRGDAYAAALFKLGEIEQFNNNIDKALMYYDRCYLGFSGSFNWTGKAILATAKILLTQSKTDEAKKICDEFLDNKLNEASPDFEELKQFRKTL